MSKKQTVTVTFTIPAEWDPMEFGGEVVQEWYDANDDSFPEKVEQVEFRIEPGVSLVSE